MKFWELTSIMGGERQILEACLIKPEWDEYYEWYLNIDHLVDQQDRDKLDAILPENLVKDALRGAILKYYVDEISFPGEVILRGRRTNDEDAELSALLAYEKYGGRVLEDTLEKGSHKIG